MTAMNHGALLKDIDYVNRPQHVCAVGGLLFVGRNGRQSMLKLGANRINVESLQTMLPV